MTWHYILYGLPSVFAVVISTGVGVAAWRRRPAPGTSSLVLLAGTSLLWAVLSVVKLLWPDPGSQYLSMQVLQIAVVGIPASWFVFALDYAGLDRWLTWRKLACLLSLEVILLLGVFTNALHGWMWPVVRLDPSGAFPVLATERGPWWWVIVAVGYAQIVIGTIVIVWQLWRSWALYRRQAAVMLLGVLVPWLTDILYVLKITPEQYDLMPLAFSLGGLCFLWGCYRFRMLDLVPVAREKVFDSMADAVIVVDASDRVVDLNRPAQRLLEQPAARVIGQDVGQCFGAWPDLVARYRHVSAANDEIVVGEGENQEIYDLQLSLLHSRRGQVGGRLLVLRDVTRHKQAEAEIRRLNAHLEDQVRERTRQLTAANERLEVLSRQLMEVQEQERRHLALELHDELGQILNSVKLSLDLMSQLPAPAARSHHERAQTLTADLIHRVRELALDLRPSMLDDLGLVTALKSLCKRHASQAGVQANFETRVPEPCRFSPSIEIAIYRIAQEALTNASRHAGVDQVRVTLQADDNQLTLEISDTGAGFWPEAVLTTQRSTGLSGMRERVRLLGGSLTIDSAPGQGTRLTACLPVRESTPATA
jgi:PAS domain S-box-containing protein